MRFSKLSIIGTLVLGGAAIAAPGLPDDAPVAQGGASASKMQQDGYTYGYGGTSPGYPSAYAQTPAGSGPARPVNNPVSVAVQAGVEAYSGNLNSHLNPGPTYGLNIQYEPSDYLGLELGFSGATNSVKNASSFVNGADVVRSGGQFVLTPGVTIPANSAETASVKPYVMGGIGWDWYSLVGSANLLGYRDQNMGTAPVGAGVRVRAGQFVADARFNYTYDWTNTGFSTFANSTWRYDAQLAIGGAF